MSVSLSNIFGQSPIEPLQKHMLTATNCAKELIPFIDSVLEEDWEKAKVYHTKICKLEHDADLIKKELKLNLPRSLFSQIPRADILGILDAQDRIANKSEDIAGIIIGRKIVLPTDIQKLYKLFIEESVAASLQAHTAIQELGELLATGFSGKEINIISEMIVRLDEIERNTDHIQVSTRNQLFKIEKSLPPIECMFLYKLIDWTGDLADRAQTVGGKLQLLLAK